MAEEAGLSEDEVAQSSLNEAEVTTEGLSLNEEIAELKSRLHKQWRQLASLRKRVHTNQMVPYSDALESTAGWMSPASPYPLDNVSLKARLRFHYFRGAFVRRISGAQMLVQFNSSYKGHYLEQFMVLLEANNGRYSVVKASLPVSVELSKIEKRFLLDDNNLLGFIQFIQTCVDAYTFRKFDFIEFKELASKKFVANLCHTLNLHFVYMTVWLKDKSRRHIPLKIILKYDPDSCIPTDMKVTAVSEGDEEFAIESKELLSYFVKVPLNEAFALGVKDEMSEMLLEGNRSSDVMRASMEADSSKARSVRRVLKFPSSASSGSEPSSEGNSSELDGEGSGREADTLRKSRRSVVKKGISPASRIAASETRSKPTQRLTRGTRGKNIKARGSSHGRRK